jgi:hypothetical protein
MYTALRLARFNNHEHAWVHTGNGLNNGLRHEESEWPLQRSLDNLNRGSIWRVPFRIVRIVSGFFPQFLRPSLE